MKQVKIKIKKDGSGNITFDMDGFQGTECTDLSEKIEASIGATDVDREMKQEMYIDDNIKPQYNELS